MAPKAELATQTHIPVTPERLEKIRAHAFDAIRNRASLDVEEIKLGKKTKEELDSKMPKRGRDAFVYLFERADNKYTNVHDQLVGINKLINESVEKGQIPKDVEVRMRTLVSESVAAFDQEAIPEYLDVAADFDPPKDTPYADLKVRARRVILLQAYMHGEKPSERILYREADKTKNQEKNTQSLSARIALKVAAATPKHALINDDLNDTTKKVTEAVAMAFIEETGNDYTLLHTALNEATELIKHAMPGEKDKASVRTLEKVIERMRNEITITQITPIVTFSADSAVTVTSGIIDKTLQEVEAGLLDSAPETLTLDNLLEQQTQTFTAENDKIIAETLQIFEVRELLKEVVGEYAQKIDDKTIQKIHAAYKRLMRSPKALGYLSAGTAALAGTLLVVAFAGHFGYIPNLQAANTEPTKEAAHSAPAFTASSTHIYATHTPSPTETPQKPKKTHTPMKRTNTPTHTEASPKAESITPNPIPTETRKPGPPPAGPSAPESIFSSHRTPEQDQILANVFKLFGEGGLQILIPGYTTHLHGLPDPQHPKDGPDKDDFRSNLVSAAIEGADGVLNWPGPRDPIFNRASGFHPTGNLIDNEGKPIALDGDIIVMSHNINILAGLPGSQSYGTRSLSLVEMKVGQLIHLTDKNGNPVATYKVIHKDAVNPHNPMKTLLTLNPQDKNLGERLFIISCDDQTVIDPATLDNDRQVVTAELIESGNYNKNHQDE